MDIPLHPTDRIIKRSKFYILRKKYLRPPYIVFLVFVLGILITKYLLTEVPPKNVINHTRYGRNTVNIHLIPESVTINPVYEFGKLSENQYFLDIHDSHIRFESERNYDYGAISKIEYHRLDSKKTRITFTFSLLKMILKLPIFRTHPIFKYILTVTWITNSLWSSIRAMAETIRVPLGRKELMRRISLWALPFI